MIRHRIEFARLGDLSRFDQLPFQLIAHEPAFIADSWKRRGLPSYVNRQPFGHPPRRAPAAQYFDHRVSHLVEQSRVQNAAPPKQLKRLQFDSPPAGRARRPTRLSRGRNEISSRRMNYNLVRPRLLKFQ